MDLDRKKDEISAELRCVINSLYSAYMLFPIQPDPPVRIECFGSVYFRTCSIAFSERLSSQSDLLTRNSIA